MAEATGTADDGRAACGSVDDDRLCLVISGAQKTAQGTRIL